MFNFSPGLLFSHHWYLQTQQRRRGEEFLSFISITAKPRLLSRWVCGNFLFRSFQTQRRREEREIFLRVSWSQRICAQFVPGLRETTLHQPFPVFCFLGLVRQQAQRGVRKLLVSIYISRPFQPCLLSVFHFQRAKILATFSSYQCEARAKKFWESK